MQVNLPKRPPLWREPVIYRHVAFLCACLGALLALIGQGKVNMWNFTMIVMMFSGAIFAIIAVAFALWDKRPREAIWNIVLLLWLVLFPLGMLNYLSHQPKKVMTPKHTHAPITNNHQATHNIRNHVKHMAHHFNKK